MSRYTPQSILRGLKAAAKVLFNPRAEPAPATPQPRAVPAASSNLEFARFVFQGKRIGRGRDMSADGRALREVLAVLEHLYPGAFSGENKVDMALKEDGAGDEFVLSISTKLSPARMPEFNRSVLSQLARVGFKV